MTPDQIREKCRELLAGGLGTAEGLSNCMPGVTPTQVDVALRDGWIEFRQIAGNWQGWRWALASSAIARGASAECVGRYAKGAVSGYHGAQSNGRTAPAPTTSPAEVEQALRLAWQASKLRTLVAAHPDCTQEQLAAHAGVGLSALSPHLRRFQPFLTVGRVLKADARGHVRRVRSYRLAEGA